MKSKIFIAALLAMFVMSSCRGFYTSYGTSSAKCSKEGIVKKRVWLGLAFNVDVSISKAAENGGISKIATVDYIVKPGFLSMLYITRVSGE